MNFKGIIFKSKYSGATYLWNGISVICVLAPEDPKWKKDREVGQVMKGFKDVDFQKLYQSDLETFLDGACIIINKF